MQLKRKRNQTDRVVFNGHDLSALVYCKVHRPIMATVDAKFEDVPGGHGEHLKSVRRAGYDLPVEMWIRTEHRREVAEARHRLAAMLWSEEPAPLFLPDDPTRHLMAIVTGDTDLGEITDGCPATTVTFHVTDPDYRGSLRRVDFTGSASFSVGGTLPAPLSVTARPGRCDSWRITNGDTGEYVEVAGPFTADSVVRLDMDTERATVNGKTAQVSIFSDFFKVSGRAHLKASVGTATVVWEERWL